SRAEIDATVESSCFTRDAGSEVERRSRLVPHAVSEGEAPQPGIGDRLASGVLNAVDERTGVGVVTVDDAITEVPDEQHVAERAEVRRRESDTPRRIQRAAGRHQMLEQVALRVEHVHEPQAGTV